MGYGTSALFDEVREIAFGAISDVFTPVGSPIGDFVRIIAFNNGMDEDLYVSFDGITDQLRMSPNSFKLFDISANKIRDEGLFLAVGTQIFVREVSASVASGEFWIEILHADSAK